MSIVEAQPDDGVTPSLPDASDCPALINAHRTATGRFVAAYYALTT
jgi:hypothetical protein